jgi:hypothetical protein
MSTRSTSGCRCLRERQTTTPTPSTTTHHLPRYDAWGDVSDEQLLRGDFPPDRRGIIAADSGCWRRNRKFAFQKLFSVKAVKSLLVGRASASAQRAELKRAPQVALHRGEFGSSRSPFLSRTPPIVLFRQREVDLFIDHLKACAVSGRGVAIFATQESWSSLVVSPLSQAANQVVSPKDLFQGSTGCNLGATLSPHLISSICLESSSWHEHRFS